MTEKVKLPKEVCDALDVVKELTPTWSNAGIIVQTCKKGWLSEELKILNDQDADIIASALVLGYEPEQTQSEKLEYLYQNAHLLWEKRECFAYRQAIVDTLHILEIHYDWKDAE